jgi:hypothetical protein
MLPLSGNQSAGRFRRIDVLSVIGWCCYQLPFRAPWLNGCDWLEKMEVFEISRAPLGCWFCNSRGVPRRSTSLSCAPWHYEIDVLSVIGWCCYQLPFRAPWLNGCDWLEKMEDKAPGHILISPRAWNRDTPIFPHRKIH